MSARRVERTERNAERLLRGKSHPVLAVAAFASMFFFAALPFLLNSDAWFLVVPCLIGCFTSFLLVIHLLACLHGDLTWVKYIFLAMAAYLCYRAGEQWYRVALLTAGTLFCTLLITRLLGPVVPLIRQRSA